MKTFCWFHFVARKSGMIVAHQSRSLSLDTGVHGQFLVNAQMTPNGPKILSVSKTTPNPAPTNGSSSPCIRPSGAAGPTNESCGGGARSGGGSGGGGGVIHSELLKSIAGPEAEGAKLSIVKEGNSKFLTLILSNGEIRRLTTSQVEMIQAAARSKKMASSTPSWIPDWSYLSRYLIRPSTKRTGRKSQWKDTAPRRVHWIFFLQTFCLFVFCFFMVFFSIF